VKWRLPLYIAGGLSKGRRLAQLSTRQREFCPTSVLAKSIPCSPKVRLTYWRALLHKRLRIMMCVRNIKKCCWLTRHVPSENMTTADSRCVLMCLAKRSLSLQYGQDKSPAQILLH
jgi:hypothetical protein